MRPIYGEETRAEILRRLEEGESLRAICRTEGMPSAPNVLRWVKEDAEFADRYARAREIGYTLLADVLVDIADTPQIGQKTVSKATGLEITEGDMIEHRRLQIDTRKWLLAKMLPKVYGDKQQIEHSGSVSIADALREAKARREAKE